VRQRLHGPPLRRSASSEGPFGLAVTKSEQRQALDHCELDQLPILYRVSGGIEGFCTHRTTHAGTSLRPVSSAGMRTSDFGRERVCGAVVAEGADAVAHRRAGTRGEPVCVVEPVAAAAFQPAHQEMWIKAAER
jgi:hypothetical protein